MFFVVRENTLDMIKCKTRLKLVLGQKNIKLFSMCNTMDNFLFWKLLSSSEPKHTYEDDVVTSEKKNRVRFDEILQRC